MKKENIFIGIVCTIMLLILFFPRSKHEEEDKQPLIIHSIDDIPGCIYRKPVEEYRDTVIHFEKDSMARYKNSKQKKKYLICIRPGYKEFKDSIRKARK
jgi:hypothetical protein